MALEYLNNLLALGKVAPSASGAGVTPTFTGSSPGFAPAGTGAAHTAAGVYDLVLDTPCNATNGCVITATAYSTSQDTNISVEEVSDTVKRVRTGIAGAASDLVGFAIRVEQRSGG